MHLVVFGAIGACLLVHVGVVRAQADGIKKNDCEISTLKGYDFQVNPASGFAIHWGLSPELEMVSFKAVINADLPGWFGLGFSSHGDMIGSDAVVGFPAKGMAIEYDLDAKFALLIQPSPLQEITDVGVEQSEGSTSLAFTRPVNPKGIGKIPLLTGTSTPAIMIWAFGPSEQFGYHFTGGRGSIALDLFCSSPEGIDGPGLSIPSTVFPVTQAPSPQPVNFLPSTSPTTAPVPANEDNIDEVTSGASALLHMGLYAFGGGWVGNSTGAAFGLTLLGLVAAVLR